MADLSAWLQGLINPQYQGGGIAGNPYSMDPSNPAVSNGLLGDLVSRPMGGILTPPRPVPVDFSVDGATNPNTPIRTAGAPMQLGRSVATGGTDKVDTPTSGTNVVGTPASGTTEASSSGFFDQASKVLGNLYGGGGPGDSLIALGAGIASPEGWAKGVSGALTNINQQKLQQQQAALYNLTANQKLLSFKGNVEAVKKAFPNMADSQAAAVAMNPTQMEDVYKRNQGARPTMGAPFTDANGTTWQQDETGKLNKIDTTKLEMHDIVVGTDSAGNPIKKSFWLVPGASPGGASASGASAVPDPEADSGAAVPAKPGAAASKATAADSAVPVGAAYDPSGAAGKLKISAIGGIEKDVQGTKDNAVAASNTIQAINRQKLAIDNGIITGAGANWQTAARNVLGSVLGLPDNAVSNSQQFDLASKSKGVELAKQAAVSGHTTNVDMLIGQAIAGGDRSMYENAIKAAIDAQEKLATATINRHNSSVGKYKDVLTSVSPDAGQVADYYKVPMPDIYQYGSSKQQQGQDDPDIVAARAAIAQGRDRQGVINKLLKAGKNPAGL